MVECYHKLIYWPLPMLSSALYLHHNFVVEMLSIRIRKFFIKRLSAHRRKSFLGPAMFWGLFGGRGKSLMDTQTLTYTRRVARVLYNEHFKNVWRLQKKRNTEISFSSAWTFFTSPEQYLMMKNFSFHKRVNSVKSGFNLHLSEQCRTRMPPCAHVNERTNERTECCRWRANSCAGSGSMEASSWVLERMRLNLSSTP